MQSKGPLLDRLLATIHPPLRIYRSGWRKAWEQQDRLLFRRTATAIWTTFMMVYVGHFFLVDIPLKKTPLELWAKYRFGLGFAAAIAIYLINSKKFYFRSYYRLPAILSGLLYSYFQAQSMIWREQVPYAYSVIVAVLSALALNTSISFTLIYLSFCYAIQAEAWLSRPHEVPYIVSAAAVGCIAVAIFRSRMSVDLDLFLMEQRQHEIQRQLIEKQMESNEHIKAFLPKKIYDRVLHLVEQEKFSMLQAMDEVLRPRYTLASCLYSDIRGFTKIVKKGRHHILRSVLPSQKTFTDVVQENSGIPRITGDLVFAFFENEENPVKSMVDSLRCSLEMIDKQQELNAQLGPSDSIKRYVLVSFGPAIVGNTGGVDGSRDVAALGDCANILSRVDEITKKEGVKDLVGSTSVVMTREAANLTKSMFPKLSLKEIRFDQYSVSLRDFPEEKSVYVLQANAMVREIVFGPVSPAVTSYLVQEYVARETDYERKSA